MATEDPSNSALQMDRGLPLGNSLDTFNRRALHVKVGNKLTEPVPVNVVDSEPGTPIQFESPITSTTGSLQTLISETVPASTIYDLYAATCVTRTHGAFYVYVNSVLKGSGRTGPSIGALSTYTWTPRFSASAGDTIEVKFQSTSSTPLNEVEAYLKASSRST